MEYPRFPRIETLVNPNQISARHILYVNGIYECLKKILPPHFFDIAETSGEEIEDLRDQLNAFLPLVMTSPFAESDQTLSFFLFSRYRPNAYKLFFDMFTRSLVPGKVLNCLLIYAADFRLPDFGHEVYTVCEVIVSIETLADLIELKRNLPIIEMEVRLGVESGYFARRILEIKGMGVDEKMVLIQEQMAGLVRRLPAYFDRDLFMEMQHQLVICSDEFKGNREVRYLSRLICGHYLFRRSLLEAINSEPAKRHFRLKLHRARVFVDNEYRNVLSVLVGVNFLGDKEIFEEQHLLIAIQNYIPAIKVVKGSFFANRRGNEKICTVSLEIEKLEGEKFSGQEIGLLQRELPADLKDRIGHLLHPVFMPRNEEEIMRNVLSLSNQLRYIRDLPQVFISFDEQSHSHLLFTIIVVRVVIPGSPSIQSLFEKTGTFLEYLEDRCRMLGMLRKKYSKEATIFRVRLSKLDYLRQDHSIDLYKARQVLVKELTSIIGEFRDYNGGMITKQSELLCSVRDLLALDEVKYNDLLLENFFYSLSPVIMRTVLEPEALKIAFKLLLEAAGSGILHGEPYFVTTKKEANFACAMIITKDHALHEELEAVVNQLPKQAASLAHSFVQVYDQPCIGFIYCNDDVEAQELFFSSIHDTISKWGQRGQKVASTSASLILSI